MATSRMERCRPSAPSGAGESTNTESDHGDEEDVSAGLALRGSEVRMVETDGDQVE